MFLPKDRYRRVLNVSLPLVMSTASTLVMEFTDRVFLASFSLDAIAAALPAGIAAFFFITFFLGTASYVNVFVAQYHGAGQHRRIGPALWQGIYFSVIAAIALIGISSTGPWLFRLAGHASTVQDLEVIYFRTLMAGAGFNVFGAALSGFFSGRGRTRPVMLAHAVAAACNIPLDYCLINGIGPWPVLGILGAGIATVLSWIVTAALLAGLIFNRENENTYAVFSGFQIQPHLLARLVRFGGAGAVQFSLDIFAFAFFVFIVGSLGRLELAVTNIVLSINALAFMPMMGISLGTSTLVGLEVGRGEPGAAAEMVRATFHLVYLYVLAVAALFVGVPEWLIALFRSRDVLPADFLQIAENGKILLRFVTVYIFFDAGYMVFIGALKGAGDTTFIMWSLVLLSGGVMLLPLWVGIVHWGLGLYYAWGCVTFFVFCLFAVTGWRYRQRKWQNMRVIEKPAPV